MKIMFSLLTVLSTACGEASNQEFPEPEPPQSVPVFSIAGNTEIVFEADTESLLRNPCMGWGLYDDACNEVADANEYWAQQDTYARKYASFLYVRWRWSDMEPEEGKYAWVYDENYKKLIQGARDRDLKLAFRIYNNGMDNLRPGTPQFVKDAGAKGCVVGEHWTPYLDDPVFREKLGNFIKAFAEEYDDPDVVDFVDAVNVGYWGECHHLNLENSTTERRAEVLRWFTSTYGSNFKRVPLIMPGMSEFTYDLEKEIAIEENGYGFRRDGIGSHWFSAPEKEVFRSLFGSVLLIGETCYWGGDETDNLWFDDPQYHFTNWRQIYETTYQEAIDYHFNTLDLRTPVETKRWITKNDDLVRAFIQNGGYRLYPTVISFPEEIVKGRSLEIGHQWRNLATGYLPNNNKRWNYKYKVAFALLDDQGDVCQLFLDEQSDPSKFIKGSDVDYKMEINADDVAPGHYTLVVAIVDTSKNNEPGIKLAVKTKSVNGWTPVGEVNVKTVSE